MSNLWVRYHHEELVAHEEREEWAILLGPYSQGSLGILPQRGIAQQGPRGYSVAIIIDYVAANTERHAVCEDDDKECINQFGRV